jgi:hypothetical protein
VVLQDNNRFYVQGRPEISYIPMGEYTTDDNKLFLNITENEQFIFSYINSRLIFESGTWLENWIEIGTVLTLSEAASPTLTLSETASPTHSPLMSSWKPLHELPADYSLEQALAEGVYVNNNGLRIYNQVMADQFYADVYSGGAAFLRVMQYTREGDAVITDIQYDGTIFTVNHDNTRDMYSAESDRAISTAKYRHLVLADRTRTGSEYDSYYLSNELDIYAPANSGSVLIYGIWPLPSPSPQSERAPQLEVALTADGFPVQRIEAAQLTTSWSYINENGDMMGYEVDYHHALQLDDYGDITLILNGNNGEIVFNFGVNIPLSVAVQRWDAVYYMGQEYVESSFYQSETVTARGNAIRINNDRNDYIYEVYALFEQGSSYYAFRVNSGTQ